MENEDARRAYEVHLQELMVQRLQIGAMLALAMPPIGVALVGFADPYSFRFMMAFLLIVYAFVLILIPWSRTRWFYRHSFTLGMTANVLLVAVVAWLVINMDVAWTSPVMAILLCIASVCVGSLYPFHAWQAGLFSLGTPDVEVEAVFTPRCTDG